MIDIKDGVKIEAGKRNCSSKRRTNKKLKSWCLWHWMRSSNNIDGGGDNNNNDDNNNSDNSNDNSSSWLVTQADKKK